MHGQVQPAPLLPAQLLGAVFPYRVEYAPTHARGSNGTMLEHQVNGAMADELARCFGPWRKYKFLPEVTDESSGRRVYDIKLFVAGAEKVVIECAHGGDRGHDARRRLEEIPDVHAAIAVGLPDTFKEQNESPVECRRRIRGRADFQYALYERNGDILSRFPRAGSMTGSVVDIGLLAIAASVPSADVEKMAREAVAEIKQAAEILEQARPSDIKKIKKKFDLKTPVAARKVIAMIWLDAMLVHIHLREQGAVDTNPLDESLSILDRAQQWRAIVGRNWRAIFKPAVRALKAIGKGAPTATQNAMTILRGTAHRLSAAGLGDHVNIGGELFQRIVPDRESVAAYYTKPATAELLAALLIRRKDRSDKEWTDPELFSKLSIGDFACGTGTLLRAAYRRIRQYREPSDDNHSPDGDHEQREKNARDRAAKFHVRAMEGAACDQGYKEGGLTGADINTIAAHLTNSGLAMMGLGESYHRPNIGQVAVGKPVRGGRTTGSLEFLAATTARDLLDDMGGTVSETGRRRKKSIQCADASFDYIIMNPPYTRTHGGGGGAFEIGGLSDAEREECQKRMQKLNEGTAANKVAGMASSFLCLARIKIKPGCRIGFVLPMTAAFADKWTDIRKMIVDDFEEIIAAAPAGAGVGGKESQSADTGMGEMLLIARRKKEKSPPSNVLCVTTKKNTNDFAAAAETAKAILSAVMDIGPRPWMPIYLGDDEIGVASAISAPDGEPWSHLGALNSELTISAWNIAERGLLAPMEEGRGPAEFPMTTIKKFFGQGAANNGEREKIGPETGHGGTHHIIGHDHRHQETGAFTWYPIGDKDLPGGRYRSLWSAEGKKQTRLIAAPTHKGVVRDKNAMENIKLGAGRLHYQRNMRWTSQALLAATTRKNVYGGSAWLTLVHEDEAVRKAFAIWANSTLGLLVHWTRGGRTQGGRARTQVGAIETMPCIDLNAIDRALIHAAAAAFDELAGLELKPARMAHTDETRRRIDGACADMLSLNECAREDIENLRQLWCDEPTVQGDSRPSNKPAAPDSATNAPPATR